MLQSGGSGGPLWGDWRICPNFETRPRSSVGPAFLAQRRQLPGLQDYLCLDIQRSLLAGPGHRRWQNDGDLPRAAALSPLALGRGLVTEGAVAQFRNVPGERG